MHPVIRFQSFSCFPSFLVYRTEDPPASRELLGVLEIDKWFSYLEIFPSRKFAHFEK